MTSPNLSALADSLNASASTLSPQARLAAFRNAMPGRIVFTTSLGLEDQAITQMIASERLGIDIITLDTGRMFPETYALWQETEERYGVTIRPFYPNADAIESLVAKQGINGFYSSIEARKACCEVRKIVPLARALKDAAGWITGLRADQSEHRGALSFVTHDAARGLLKLNPIFDWTREQTLAYTQVENIPVNPLHAKGFLSIGCAPCTRALQPGEDERAGRWWWENEAQKECGLHITPDGKIVRARGDEASAS
jgi:phosphoadenosine phosphosulfate reductase